MLEEVTHINHDCFMIKADKIFYFDPFNVPEDAEKADVILITHDHFDHLSIKDVKTISTKDTLIFVTPDGQSKLADFPGDVRLVEPGHEYEMEGYIVKTIPAYNIGKRFHPKENEWVGYILEVNGKRYYHAGDTDLIPEMKRLKNIDVAFLPVSGTYVMNAEEAAKAADLIKPKVAVPMHYGEVVGSEEDAKRFKELYDGETEIL